jgi:hypothetical protein
LEFQDLVGKHPDAEVQLCQLFKVLCDIQDVAGYVPPSVGESEEWTIIVNTVEENCVNYCKALSGRTLYSALYGTYSISLKELKGLVKAGIFGEEQGIKEVKQQRRRASKKSAGIGGTAPTSPLKLQRKQR